MNERSRWPFFDPSPWANGLTENKQTKTDPGVPQSTLIILQQSTNICNILKRNEVYMVRVLPVVFSRVRVLHLDVALRDEFVSALVAHGNESTGHMHYRERFSICFIFFLFFSSILFLFLLESSGVSGSRMSLTSKKSGAPHLRKSHSCTAGKPTKSTNTIIVKKREPLPIPRRWKPPAKWSGFSSFQSGKLLLSKLCPMHVALC